MAIPSKDPLLTAGKIMTMLLMGLTGIVTVFLIGLIPFLLFNSADFAKIVNEAGNANVTTAMVVAIVLLLSASAITAMAFHFFQLLRRLIDTVGELDPFTQENAERLSRMGWIAILFQLATFPISAMAVYLDNAVPSENLNADFDFSLTGVLLAVVLFILARVFRHGATMREDLEGTV